MSDPAVRVQGDTQLCPNCRAEVAWDETASPASWRHTAHDSRWCLLLASSTKTQPDYPTGATDPRRKGYNNPNDVRTLIQRYTDAQQVFESETSSLVDAVASGVADWAEYLTTPYTAAISGWAQTHADDVSAINILGWRSDEEFEIEEVAEDAIYVQDSANSFYGSGFPVPRGFLEDRAAWIAHDQKDAEVRRRQHKARLEQELRQTEQRLAELRDTERSLNARADALHTQIVAL